MRIYGALKATEVWRFRKGRLEFHLLGEDGKYALLPASRAFPAVRSDDINSFLALRGQMDHNAIVRKLREWIRGKP